MLAALDRPVPRARSRWTDRRCCQTNDSTGFGTLILSSHRLAARWRSSAAYEGVGLPVIDSMTVSTDGVLPETAVALPVIDGFQGRAHNMPCNCVRRVVGEHMGARGLPHCLKTRFVG